MDSLTDTEQQMLATESEFWRYPAMKDAAIRDRFGISPVRYYQLLGQLIESEQALAAAPLIVNRLRRLAVRNKLRA